METVLFSKNGYKITSTTDKWNGVLYHFEHIEWDEYLQDSESVTFTSDQLIKVITYMMDKGFGFLF